MPGAAMVGTASTAGATTSDAASATMTSDATVTATRKTVARANVAMVVGATMSGIPTVIAADIQIDPTRDHCQKWSGV